MSRANQQSRNPDTFSRSLDHRLKIEGTLVKQSDPIWRESLPIMKRKIAQKANDRILRKEIRFIFKHRVNQA